MVSTVQSKPPSPSNFSTAVLEWYAGHGRYDLPWQRDVSPYRVWISEIMLQQTQVTAVIPYFKRFMERFPSLEHLAAAETDEVLHQWSGLGYYARARNLHRAAQIIVEQHGGKFPESLEQVMALPGIGRSTAGAILAFCYAQRQPILDGNVKRVLCRCFAITGNPSSSAVQKTLWQLADDLTPAHQVSEYTQAIMDLGATVCTRSRPACERCPLQADCAGLAQGNPLAYPQRKARRQRPQRDVTMLVVQNQQNQVLLEKRPASGIWGGLWSLPELSGSRTEAELLRQNFNLVSLRSEPLPDCKHGFTHFDLLIHPRRVEARPSDDWLMDATDYLWYNIDDPQPVGLPAAISRLLESL